MSWERRVGSAAARGGRGGRFLAWAPDPPPGHLRDDEGRSGGRQARATAAAAPRRAVPNAPARRRAAPARARRHRPSFRSTTAHRMTPRLWRAAGAASRVPARCVAPRGTAAAGGAAAPRTGARMYMAGAWRREGAGMRGRRGGRGSGCGPRPRAYTAHSPVHASKTAVDAQGGISATAASPGAPAPTAASAAASATGAPAGTSTQKR